MLSTTRLYPCITFAWILSSLIAPYAFAAPWCGSTFDLEPNTVWRGSAPEEHTFRWLLPSPGIATVDLLADESASAWIDVLAGACGEQVPEVLVIEQSSRHLVLAVRSAGHLYLATDAEASPFRLITNFTQAEVVEEAFDFGNPEVLAIQTSFLVPNPADKVEPEDVDPEPDGLRAVGSQLSASFLTLMPARALKVEPEDVAKVLTLMPAHGLKVEPEDVDPEPDGLTASSASGISSTPRSPWWKSAASESERFSARSRRKIAGISVIFRDLVTQSWRKRAARSKARVSPRAPSQVLLFEPICRRTELDDHGDTMSCSTPLTFGRSVTGELANDWRDDSDVFSFRLSKVSKVEIALAVEDPGSTYELLGPTGRRLAVDRLEGNDAASMHLVSTLAPGRYFFRVAGTSGAYAINTVTYD